MWTLALEEVDHLTPQVNRVQEERSSSLNVGELNENIEKLLSWLSASSYNSLQSTILFPVPDGQEYSQKLTLDSW